MAIVSPDIRLSSPSFLGTAIPFAVDTLFPQSGAPAVEIGCGNGHFLTGLAASRPESNFIGIDVRYKRIEKSCFKADRLRLANVRFMLNDALEVLDSYFYDGSILAFYVNFPDPWPKFKHRKFRLNRIRFIQLMVGCLQEDGDLWWVCDHYPQIVDVVGLCREMAAQGYLRNCHEPEGFSVEEPEYPSTLYEWKWRSEGRPIFYIRFRRTGKPFVTEVSEG